MKKVWIWRILLFIMVVLFPDVTGAVDNKLPGARAISLSSAVVALPGSEGLFHNQAGLAYQNNISVVMSYESEFLLKELSLMAAGIVVPAAPGTFSAVYYRFGSGFYNENKFGLAFSRKFGNIISAALQFDYFSENYPENSSPFAAFTLEGGLIIGNQGKFLAGIHFFNPVMAEMKMPWGKESIPRTVRAGSSWMIAPELIICSEIEKTNKLPMVFKTGVEYNLNQSISIRAGMSCTPLKFTGGAGFHLGKMLFDIAFSYHGNLGFTPSAGLTFVL
jgi:hypothetical protein